MTGTTLFYNAFRRAGILAEAGRGISSSETTDALEEVNALFGEWRAQRLTVYAEDRQEFPLVSGQQAYKIGIDSAADWQAQMPSAITRAGYVFNTTNPPVEEPFDIYTTQQWQALSPKTLQSTNPYVLWYEQSTVNGAVSDMGTVWLWPVPIDATITVALYLWQQMMAISDPTANIVFPPGYQIAVESNLAVRLAARFPKRARISPITGAIAQSSLARIKAMNDMPLQMRVEQGDMQASASQGIFNLFSNAYNRRVS
ncbi:MAG: hypothetical protein ACLGXA_20505 [Acidobacteriota bacterium]